MFFPLLLLLQSPAALPTMDEVDFNECMRLASGDAQSGIVRANEWAQKGGGWRAKQCLGFSQFKAGNAAAALTAYEQAAQQATTAKAGDSGKLWVQAGNAALLAGQPPRAIDYLGKAIAGGQLRGEGLGEAHIDRARAHAAAGDMAKAKADLEQAHNLVPQDPLGWLLSATLARREGDLPRARNDIATAAKIAGGDPAIARFSGRRSRRGLFISRQRRRCISRLELRKAQTLFRAPAAAFLRPFIGAHDARLRVPRREPHTFVKVDLVHRGEGGRRLQQ